MAFTKIQTTTVGSGGAASIEFTNIPQSYKHLKILCLIRSTRASAEDGMGVKINTATSGYTYKVLNGDGSSISTISNSYEAIWALRIGASSMSSGAFTAVELVFPNYSNSTDAKVYFGNSGAENNGTTGYLNVSGVSQSATNAITSITLSSINANIAQYSTATLYGIE